jgi:hypothetical protein
MEWSSGASSGLPNLENPLRLSEDEELIPIILRYAPQHPQAFVSLLGTSRVPGPALPGHCSIVCAVTKMEERYQEWPEGTEQEPTLHGFQMGNSKNLLNLPTLKWTRSGASSENGVEGMCTS